MKPVRPLVLKLRRRVLQSAAEQPELDSAALDNDYTPEMGQTNPFLHMGMHIALYEQLSTNRPAGIKDVYEKLQRKTEDIHETEHRMMECLGEAMWQAQRNNTMPDDASYLLCLKKLS